MAQLAVGEVSLRFGLVALGCLGFRDGERVFSEEFQIPLPSETLLLSYDATLAATIEQQQASLRSFLVSLQEEQFQRRYFADVPVSVAQTVMDG